MAKETYYFSHDYNARTDEKIKSLLRKHGLAGYGLFWSIVEDLYNNANALRFDCEGFAFEYRTSEETVSSVIKDFGLFVFDGDIFGSMSVQKRLGERANKSLKARKSALKRWSKDAIVMPSECERIELGCEGNAIKERKGKEIKVKETKKAEYDFSFLDESFKDTFIKWIEYKKGRAQAYKTQSSLEACYNKLLSISDKNPKIAEECVNDSMANNYSGLFAPKKTYVHPIANHDNKKHYEQF